MATKIFKYFSNMFVVKEREMEIGCPTDVKHVAHIGWDGPSDSAPSWMNEFKNKPDFSTSSLGRTGEQMGSSNPVAYSPWSSQAARFSAPVTRQHFPSTKRNMIAGAALQKTLASLDFEQSMGRQPSGLFRDLPPVEVPNIPKKPKRKKTKSSSPSASRSLRSTKSKATVYTQMEATQNLLV